MKDENFSESLHSSDTIMTVGKNIYDHSNIKVAVLLFIVYIIINSDTFIESCLSTFIDDMYDNTNDKLTSKGIMITGILLSLTYILLDVFNKGNYL